MFDSAVEVVHNLMRKLLTKIRITQEIDNF